MPEPMEQKRKIGYNSVAVGIFVLTAFVLYFLFSWVTPPMLDDFMFLRDYMLHNDESQKLTLKGFLGFSQFMRATDNSRLMNLLWPVYGIAAPKFVLSALIGGSMAFTLYLIAKLSAPGGKVSPFWFVFVWIATIIALPWRGNMITGVFAENYMVSSAFNLLFIFLLCRKYGNGGNIRPLTAVCLVLLSVFTGALHEGFSAPVLVGIGVWFCIRRFKVPGVWWMMTVAYALGLLWLLTSPSLWINLSNSDENSIHINFDIKYMLPILLPSIGLILTLAVIWVKSSYHAIFQKMLADPIFIIISFAYIAEIILMARLGFNFSRTEWILNIFCISLLTYILQHLRRNFSTTHRLTSHSITFLGFSIIVAFYINVIHWQIYFSNQQKEMFSQLKDSTHGTMYYDYDTRCSKITLLHPTYNVWWQWHNLYQFNRFAPAGKTFVPVAKALSDLSIPFDSLPPVCGNAGMRQYKDVLLHRDMDVAPLSDRKWDIEPIANVANLDIVNENGDVYDSMESLFLRFIAPTGERMIYVRPLHYKVKGPYSRVDFSN